jgi:Flp pilus assembly pilin Flp
MQRLIAFLNAQDGTTLMEYSVISSLISLAAIAFTVALNVQMMGLFVQ